MSEINNGQKNEITKEVKIMFGQCGYNGKLHLEQVMQYCADLVTDLYTQNGQSRAFLNSHGYVQMVSRSSIHINRFPCENEKIIITVREEKPEGFQMMRYYNFSDEKGEKLIEGKSLWVIVEPVTREVISPDKFEFCIKSDSQTPFERKPGKIRFSSDLLQYLGEQKILLSHLDPNGHLTNSRYINFALDFLPEKYQEKTITDFKLNFCKEIKKGESMYIFGIFDDEAQKIIVAGKYQNNVKSESSFECELIYK